MPPEESEVVEHSLRIVLTDRQQALTRVLAERNPDLSKMFVGALMALNDNANPDNLAQAAHGIREMMEKLPKYLDVPFAAHSEKLMERVRNLASPLNHAKAKSACYEGGRWTGEIDKPVRTLLVKVVELFSWLDTHLPRRSDEAAELLRQLDLSGRRLPYGLEQQNVRIWQGLQRFFQAVAHHNQVPGLTTNKFSQRVNELEQFLFDRMLPQTTTDLTEIDSILKAATSSDD